MKAGAFWISLAGVWLLPFFVWAADPFSRSLKEVEEGNARYEEKHFEQALENFEQAEQAVSQEPRIHFNRGAALFKLGRTKEAREAFLRATGTDDPELKKRNYYNVGNTFLSEQAFPDAVSYYRRALEIDSRFDDARFNLEVALRAMKEQKQKEGSQKDQQKDQNNDQKKDGNKDQNKDQKDQQGKNENQDQQKDQQKESEKTDEEQKQKEPEKGQEQPKQEQQNQGSGEQEKDQEQQQQQDQKSKGMAGAPPDREEPGRLSEAQAMDLLDASRENEKPFQMQRFMLPEFKRQDRKVEKDW